MLKPTVSVIIPVYNSEKYLVKCLESIMSQTYENIEIICIDDGSTDSSCEILYSYQKKDFRIIVLKQQNRFAGAARNAGIKAATGKYIIFVDSDDFLDTNAIEKIVASAEEKKTQILIYDINKYDNNEERVLETAEKMVRPELFGDSVHSSKEIKKYIFMFAGTAPWNKCYLRSFLLENNLQFPELQRMEDLPFVLISLTYAERIGILKDKIYFYRMNVSNSLQATIGSTPTIFIDSILLLKNNLVERELFNDYEESYYELCLWMSNYTLSLMQRDSYLKMKSLVECGIFKELGLNGIIINGIDQKKEILAYLDKEEKIVIYGAGMMAKCLVKYLKYAWNYSDDNIQIVVSSLDNNCSNIMGIKVEKYIPSLYSNHYKFLIAIDNREVSDAIRRQLLNENVKDISCIGYIDMLQLFCSN